MLSLRSSATLLPTRSSGVLPDKLFCARAHIRDERRRGRWPAERQPSAAPRSQPCSSSLSLTLGLGRTPGLHDSEPADPRFVLDSVRIRPLMGRSGPVALDSAPAAALEESSAAIGRRACLARSGAVSRLGEAHRPIGDRASNVVPWISRGLGERRRR